MIGNQTMVHHVWPRHLYSRDGTCTSGDLCRRPSSFMEFHIFYLVGLGVKIRKVTFYENGKHSVYQNPMIGGASRMLISSENILWTKFFGEWYHKQDYGKQWCTKNT